MSKMKQHLEKQIVITGSRHEVNGWKRYIHFNYQGNEHEVILFWDEFDGYEVNWYQPSETPDWVDNWDSEAHKGMTFEWYLDELTYKREEE